MQAVQILTSLVLAAFAGYMGAWYFGAIEGNFALLLFLATVVTGAYWLAERFYFLPQRHQCMLPMPQSSQTGGRQRIRFRQGFPIGRRALSERLDEDRDERQEQEHEEQRRHHRSGGAEGDVAEDIEGGDLLTELAEEVAYARDEGQNILRIVLHIPTPERNA